MWLGLGVDTIWLDQAAADGKEVEAGIQQALKEMQKTGVKGAEVGCNCCASLYLSPLQ